jgi:hypothetical protein
MIWRSEKPAAVAAAKMSGGQQMATEKLKLPGKVIVVRLRGGIRDGTEFRSDSTDAENQQRAILYWDTMDEGTNAKKVLLEASPEAIKKLTTLRREAYLKQCGDTPSYGYGVAEKQETDDAIILDCQYVGVFKSGRLVSPA